MRWPRQLMSLLVVLALLAGPPAVLLFLIGPPVNGWPTTKQIQAWVQQPLTEETLTAALTIGAWLLWLLLAYTVTVRAVTRLQATAAWLRHVPLPTPLQATASGMAGAAVFGISTHPVTTAAPQPPPSSAAGTPEQPAETNPTPDDTAVSDDGILLPGGWLPRDTAESVAAAAALLWLRRRRDYRPRALTPNAPDAHTAGLPPAVASVQAGLADAPAASHAPGPSDSFTAPGGVIPAGGLGLTGPGALPIGRGLLLTAVLAGHRHFTPTLAVTRAALTDLLGPDAEPLGRRLPQLTIVENPAGAIRLIEGADPPRMVILAEADRDADDLTRLAGLTAANGGRLVVLGGWPTGQTWHAAPTGHLHDPTHPDNPAPRLCVLDQVTAVDLLAVIAHPEPTTPSPATPRTPLPSAVTPGPRLQRQSTRGVPHQRPTASIQRPHLRVLGEPTLIIGGEPLTIRRSAAVQVLAFLAAHPNGADTRELTAAIWPGLPRHSLTGRLYTTLSDLRGAIRTASGLHVIDHTDDRYRLNPADVDVDLWHLHAVIQQAATTITDTTTAWQAVRDAYPADLAAGRTWPWLDPIREATRRRLIDACAALADSENDPRRALVLLQDGVDIDPYNADLHARLVTTLTALGDHEAADQQHNRYLRTLAQAGIEDEPLGHHATRSTTAQPEPAPPLLGATQHPTSR
ncbi:BTAD domain-containing putative transcriptional regulator [Micromonospora arida]|uniref:AfsR/SARP family transcriptional regulator n=1 Tax=Micromonospora arida TaxID=2203715 RepID=UPI003400556D